MILAWRALRYCSQIRSRCTAYPWLSVRPIVDLTTTMIISLSMSMSNSWYVGSSSSEALFPLLAITSLAFEYNYGWAHSLSTLSERSFACFLCFLFVLLLLGFELCTFSSTAKLFACWLATWLSFSAWSFEDSAGPESTILSCMLCRQASSCLARRWKVAKLSAICRFPAITVLMNAQSMLYSQIVCHETHIKVSPFQSRWIGTIAYRVLMTRGLARRSLILASCLGPAEMPEWLISRSLWPARMTGYDEMPWQGLISRSFWLRNIPRFLFTCSGPDETP